MFKIGTGELILIFLIIFLLFGAAKLPELARAMAKALKEFKREIKDVNESVDEKK